jgi:hypothetical protein
LRRQRAEVARAVDVTASATKGLTVTPVIAMRRGAMPEIVVDGVTDAVCASIAAMITAVG